MVDNPFIIQLVKLMKSASQRCKLRAVTYTWGCNIVDFQYKGESLAVGLSRRNHLSLVTPKKKKSLDEIRRGGIELHVAFCVPCNLVIKLEVLFIILGEIICFLSHPKQTRKTWKSILIFFCYIKNNNKRKFSKSY